MRLYTYFRSSAAYRVRIALALKNLPYESVPVHLLRDGGEQHQPSYRAINPQGLVPALGHDGQLITQSLAIIEYLDETHPTPPLLPTDAAGRARVRGLAQMIACDVHPLNNLRVLRFLTDQLGASDEAKNRWYQHWIAQGFAALEARLRDDGATGAFCHGDAPGMADCLLVPQMMNARRFSCDVTPYPTLVRIEQRCLALEAFARAAPAAQPDAEP